MLCDLSDSSSLTYNKELNMAGICFKVVVVFNLFFVINFMFHVTYVFEFSLGIKSLTLNCLFESTTVV